MKQKGLILNYTIGAAGTFLAFWGKTDWDIIRVAGAAAVTYIAAVSTFNIGYRIIEDLGYLIREIKSERRKKKMIELRRMLDREGQIRRQHYTVKKPKRLPLLDEYKEVEPDDFW